MSDRMQQTAFGKDAGKRTAFRVWPDLWWRILDLKIGIVPVPILISLLGLVWGFSATGTVPADILMNIGVLSIGGFLCAEVGKRIPLLRHLGAAAIFATFVPSYLVHAHLLPAPIIASISQFTRSSNFLYLFISLIIVGSILGMERHALISGFLKIFVPMALGSVAAALVGTLTAMALGLNPFHAFFFVILPVMAGGVGEGAIPLSVGYAGILHQKPDESLAQLLPPVMLGSLIAILIAGGLNFLGKSRPHLTGAGRLVPSDEVDAEAASAPSVVPDVTTIAAGGVTAVTLYLAGALVQRVWGWPAPVTMLFLAVLLKLAHAISPSLQGGAFVVYRFFAAAVTFPLLFAMGVSLTPWERLVSAVTIANVGTIAATVVALVATGFYVGRYLGMYPIDVAIVNACRSAQGGTGDVAILSAADRMQLMPFAQIATRIGGAITVTLALILLARFA